MKNKRIYVSKQKLKKYLINNHCFHDVIGGGKRGRLRMAGPMKTRSTTIEKNQTNNRRVFCNPVVRLKQQEAKTKSRWTIIIERQ